MLNQVHGRVRVIQFLAGSCSFCSVCNCRVHVMLRENYDAYFVQHLQRLPSRDVGHDLLGDALKILQLFRLAGTGNVEDEFPYPLRLIGKQVLNDLPRGSRQQARVIVGEVYMSFRRDSNGCWVPAPLLVQRCQNLALLAELHRLELRWSREHDRVPDLS